MSISRDDIESAYARISGAVRATPVIAVEAEAFATPSPLHLKLELLQHSGSFKPRGAFNALMSRAPPDAGVVAASGGNHGAAVAFAAGRLKVPAHIFVPEITSPVKIARIEAYGAKLHVGGGEYHDALDAATAFQAETGAMAIHAYDQPETLAGQGTIGLEWQRQMGAERLDTVLVAVGGGGLVGGIASWFMNDVKIVAVEPETSCCLNAALAHGGPVAVSVAGVAADSLGARAVGRLAFEAASRFVDEAVLVSDDAISAAQAALWSKLRIAAEAGGATALAALTSSVYKPAEGERVGVLICGGNVRPEQVHD